MFGMRMPPGFVGHNPLAGLTYAFVFLAYLAMILTGLSMYGASAHVDSPLRIFAGLCRCSAACRRRAGSTTSSCGGSGRSSSTTSTAPS